MDGLAIGFWGAFFGSVALMLAASIAAFIHSLHRIALTATLFSLITALFALGYLGWLPIDDPSVEARVLAHVAVVAAAVLGTMLLTVLGLLRNPVTAGATRVAMAAMAAGVLAVGWLMDPMPSLALGSLVALGVALLMLLICVNCARQGDRLAGVALSGVCCLLVVVSGLTWIAFNRAGVAWQVHAVSATAGIGYIVTVAAMVWSRYSYLIELRTVVAYGPSYDPVTRMRTHAETGQMVGLAFYREQEDSARPPGVIVVSIGNLYTLENLHGRAALNHALFVCASRLRRCVPGDVEMGRLADDGFLLLVRGAADWPRLAELGRSIAQRLSRPVVLSTSTADIEAGNALWVAQVGVGLLAATARVRPSSAVAKARAMSRTAWSYPSKIAWHDGDGRIAELSSAEYA